jgi:hypothetical protein
VKSLEVVTSIDVDYRGNIFWSVSNSDLVNGTIFRARADLPNSNTIQVVSKKLNAAYSLCYKQEFLFYSAQDSNSTIPEDGNMAIYYKNMPKSGEISADLRMIANGFEDIVSIGTFDN